MSSESARCSPQEEDAVTPSGNSTHLTGQTGPELPAPTLALAELSRPKEALTLALEAAFAQGLLQQVENNEKCSICQGSLAISSSAVCYRHCLQLHKLTEGQDQLRALAASVGQLSKSCASAYLAPPEDSQNGGSEMEKLAMACECAAESGQKLEKEVARAAATWRWHAESPLAEVREWQLAQSSAQDCQVPAAQLHSVEARGSNYHSSSVALATAFAAWGNAGYAWAACGDLAGAARCLGRAADLRPPPDATCLRVGATVGEHTQHRSGAAAEDVLVCLPACVGMGPGLGLLFVQLKRICVLMQLGSFEEAGAALRAASQLAATCDEDFAPQLQGLLIASACALAGRLRREGQHAGARTALQIPGHCERAAAIAQARRLRQSALASVGCGHWREAVDHVQKALLLESTESPGYAKSLKLFVCVALRCCQDRSTRGPDVHGEDELLESAVLEYAAIQCVPAMDRLSLCLDLARGRSSGGEEHVALGLRSLETFCASLDDQEEDLWFAAVQTLANEAVNSALAGRRQAVTAEGPLQAVLRRLQQRGRRARLLAPWIWRLAQACFSTGWLDDCGCWLDRYKELVGPSSCAGAATFLARLRSGDLSGVSELAGNDARVCAIQLLAAVHEQDCNLVRDCCAALDTVAVPTQGLTSLAAEVSALGPSEAAHLGLQGLLPRLLVCLQNGERASKEVAVATAHAAWSLLRAAAAPCPAELLRDLDLVLQVLTLLRGRPEEQETDHSLVNCLKACLVRQAVSSAWNAAKASLVQKSWDEVLALTTRTEDLLRFSDSGLGDEVRRRCALLRVRAHLGRADVAVAQRAEEALPVCAAQTARPSSLGEASPEGQGQTWTALAELEFALGLLAGKPVSVQTTVRMAARAARLPGLAASTAGGLVEQLTAP